MLDVTLLLLLSAGEANALLSSDGGNTSCQYVNEEGATVTAEPGESYSDGCNQCQCKETGEGRCSSESACLDQCRYLNSDLLQGYTGKGWVTVYGAESCAERCKCKVKKRGKRAGLARLAECHPVKMPQMCYWKMMIFKAGETFNDREKVCQCLCDGSVKCEAGEGICPYIENGETKMALIGERYSDGCNTCKCMSSGKGGCTKMFCSKMCSYKNWELVTGWAHPGPDNVQVFDEGAGCSKMCRCESGGTAMSATMNCDKGRQACIAH